MSEDEKSEDGLEVVSETSVEKKKDLDYLDGFNDLLSEWCNLPWKKRYSLAWDLCFTPNTLKDKMEDIVKDQKRSVLDGTPIKRKNKLEEI